MANVTINLSQSTLNTIDSLHAANGTSSFSQDIDLFFKYAFSFSRNHPFYSSSSIVGTTARLGFSDGGYTYFYGVSDHNPGSSSGTASATSVESYYPSEFRLTYAGQLNFEYSSASSGVKLHGTDATITGVAIQTVRPTYSTSYNSTVGNSVFSLHGALNLSEADDFSGALTSLSGRADRFLVSTTTAGNFYVSGNGLAISQNLATTAVSGALTEYTEQYSDGSTVSVTSATIPVTGSSIIDKRLLADPFNFGGNDVITVTLPAQVSSSWAIASGAGNDSVTIRGGGSLLSVASGDGNDTITLGDHGHSVDGGPGADLVVLSGNRASYTLAKNGSTFTVTDVAGKGSDILTNIERLQFSDTKLALDANGNAGEAYRLYQAAFNRTPDLGGLGFQMKALDDGWPLATVAQNFIDSPEYSATYGSLNTTAFVQQMYLNVLHRTGDPVNEIPWYAARIDSGAMTRAAVLVGFSESPENQAAVIGVIQNGMTYTI